MTRRELKIENENATLQALDVNGVRRHIAPQKRMCRKATVTMRPRQAPPRVIEAFFDGEEIQCRPRNAKI
jgi:hypothetical protein